MLPGPSDIAHAACDPAAANGVTGTCSGSTTNQGAGAPGTSGGINGYGDGTQTNVTITVSSGAAVTGQFAGLNYSSGSATNYGAISGGAAGVRGALSVNLTNYGVIASSVGDGVTSGTPNATSNITNYGTINGGSSGINLSGNLVLYNYGTVRGTNFSAVSASILNITNYGTIFGGASGGAINGTTATVNNDGNIAGGSFGIFVTSGVTVTNRGQISGATGISASTSTATVTNSGNIIGGANSAILARNANVVNSGTIQGAVGIVSTGAATITNSGTIVGTGGTAIQLSTSSDTLNFLAGSKIIGRINLGGGGDTVNLSGGNQHYVFDTLSGARVTSSTPVVVSGNEVASLDPTPFGMTDRTLMDFTGAVSSVIGIRSAAGRDPPAAFAMADPAPAQTATAGVWSGVVGGQRIQPADGSSDRARNQFFGAVVGADWQTGRDWWFGIFAGGGEGRTNYASDPAGTENTYAFGGLFGGYSTGAWFATLAAQAGYVHSSTSRTIASNLAPSGQETATASYGTWYVTPEATIGRDLALGVVDGAVYVLTPSVKVRYLAARAGSYDESGSTSNLSVASRTPQNFEERAQLNLTRIQSMAWGGALRTSIYSGVIGAQRAGDRDVRVSFLGQPQSFAVPGGAQTWGGFGGAGLDWSAGRATLYASVEYIGLADSSGTLTGRGGLRISF